MTTTSDNSELQEEEFIALSSIFGEEAFQVDTLSSKPYPAYIFRLSLENDTNNKTCKDLTLKFYFPPEYPSSEPPKYEIISSTFEFDQNIKDDIEKNFKKLFIPGEVVIFSWVEWLQDYMIDNLKIHEDDMHFENKKDKESTTNVINIDEQSEQLNEKKIECPQIVHGEQFEHKKSIFVAHLAPVYSIQQIQLVRSTLLLDKKIAKATHNIMAYRIVQENGIILQDNDDDGETAAGGRLLHLLQLVDAKNVVVVVSRWFGGIKLGPERFKDIQNCARDLLKKCGYVTDNEQKSSRKLKKKASVPKKM